PRTPTLFPYTTLFRSSNSISVLSQSAPEPQVKRDAKKPKDQAERPAQTGRLLRMSEQRSRFLRKKSVNNAERENQRSDACALERSEEHTSELQSPDHL